MIADNVGMLATLKTTTVLAAWAAATFAAVAFVGFYGRNVPFADEFQIVPYSTDFVPLDAAWIFAAHNEHRIPAVRVSLVLLSRWSKDLRTAAFLNVALLSAASLAMMLAARRARERTDVSDVVFPAAMLSLGHWENLLSGWQLQYTLTAALVCFLLCIVHLWPKETRPSLLWAAVATVCLLPLCGVNGVIYAIPASLWLAVVCWKRSRVASICAAVVLLASLWMVPRTSNEAAMIADPSSSRRAAVAAASLSTVFGAPFLPAWTLPGSEHANPGAIIMPDAMPRGVLIRAWPLWSVVAVAVLAWTALLLARMRADATLGYACLVSAAIGTAVAIGWGRALPFDVFSFVPEVGQGLSTRYALLLAPLLPACYFAWERFGASRGRIILAALALAAYLAYVPCAQEAGTDRARVLDAFAADLRSDDLAEAVAWKHAKTQRFIGREPELAWWIMCLRGFTYPCAFRR